MKLYLLLFLMGGLPGLNNKPVTSRKPEVVQEDVAARLQRVASGKKVMADLSETNQMKSVLL